MNPVTEPRSSFAPSGAGAHCWIINGQIVPVEPGDEMQIQSDIPGLMHRGLVLATSREAPPRIIHANKGTNVQVVTLEDFSQGKNIGLLRRPNDQQHATLIIQRALSALTSGLLYDAITSNCEHFTEYCYSGTAKSATLNTVVAIGVLALACFALSDSQPESD